MLASRMRLTFTLSQYGSYDLVSDVLEQVAFENPAKAIDPEMLEAENKWRKHFNLPAKVNYSSFMGLNEDLGPHAGKVIEKRRFESYAGDGRLIEGTPLDVFRYSKLPIREKGK